MKELKEYEETLVRQYKLYIDYINDSIKEVNKLLNNSLSKADLEAIKQYGIVCIKCLGYLLDKLSHFNYTIDLVEMVVQQITNKTSEVRIVIFFHVAFKRYYFIHNF